MDAALRENLSAGLSDGFDKQILAGTNGLFTGTNLANNNQTTNDDLRQLTCSNLVWNQIDGRYADHDFRTWPWWWALRPIRTWARPTRNTSVDRSALDRIMELVSGVRVSAHVPVPGTNRQNVVIRRGMSTSVVAPIWEGITIIPDERDQGCAWAGGHNGHHATRRQGTSDGWRPGETADGPQLGGVDMASILLSGPGRRREDCVQRERVLEAATEPTVAADFQTILAALTLLERQAGRALSTTSGVSSLKLASTTDRVRANDRHRGGPGIEASSVVATN